METEATSPVSVASGIPAIRIEEHQCVICKCSFRDSKLLREHLIAELGLQPELRPFLDIDLGIEPSDFTEESSPLTDTSENFQVVCHKCGKVCKTERGLSQHIGKAHSRKKRYSACPLCESSFRSKYALRFHIKQVHDQATRVACHLCGVVLYNKYMLPKHLLKVHLVNTCA